MSTFCDEVVSALVYQHLYLHPFAMNGQFCISVSVLVLAKLLLMTCSRRSVHDFGERYRGVVLLDQLTYTVADRDT